MVSSPSRIAQLSFNIVNRLSYRSRYSGPVGQFLARALNKVARSTLRRVGRGHTVEAEIYGYPMTLPAEHTIAHTLRIHPQYNRPLGVAALVIGTQRKSKSLAVVDVGANIGETVAIIDQACAGMANYLCIDADKNLAELCARNHAKNPRVETKLSFIGENEGQIVQLVDDGKANPSTKLVEAPAADCQSEYGRLARLDTIAAAFAETQGGIDLIKVDTEGYDFSILRSGAALLSKYKPGLFFEWYPKLLWELGENPSTGFEDLQGGGYRHYVFFTSVGDYYCKLSDPNPFVLETLAHVTLRDNMYFDVFATDSEAVCDEVIRLSVDYERASRVKVKPAHVHSQQLGGLR